MNYFKIYTIFAKDKISPDQALDVAYNIDYFC